MVLFIQLFRSAAPELFRNRAAELNYPVNKDTVLELNAFYILRHGFFHFHPFELNQ